MKSKPPRKTLDDTRTLRHLGSKSTDYQFEGPKAKILETFPNREEDRPYIVNFEFDEFTSLCPKTGQPDFAHISIRYAPGKTCVESKSLKLYFFAFRSFGCFMETITNKMLDDLVAVTSPRYMQVTATFKARGGITTIVTAQFISEDESPEQWGV